MKISYSKVEENACYTWWLCLMKTVKLHVKKSYAKEVHREMDLHPDFSPN